MTNKILASPTDVTEIIGRLFERDRTCLITVREDHAFSKGVWLPFGEVSVFPSGQTFNDFVEAVCFGAFEWRTPGANETIDLLSKYLAIDSLKEDAKPNAEDKIRRICDSFGSIPVRLGLSHPVFDPGALELMPFRRPTTVISDTSGVIQGGLSFVARYLHPAARIKIPAVVQMEIVNLADRFLKNRRATRIRQVDLLMDHVNSQGGQRVLLQLEFHSDVELERTYLLGDPLRGAFQREGDKELQDLSMSVPVPSYADRLILEAARQHQSQVSFGHPVMLLTGDQGLARMAMSEGMAPMYFHSAKAKAFFDRCLTGANFHPFSGSVCTTSVSDVVWELATIFGSAQLSTQNGKYALTVYAIGEDLAWAPYHSHDDLLWIEATDDLMPEKGPEPQPSPAPSRQKPSVSSASHRQLPKLQRQKASRPGSKDEQLPLYKFSVERLVTLIDALESEQQLLIASVMDLVAVKTENGLGDYRRFLSSGNAITVDSQAWFAAPVLTPVAVALRNLDISALRTAFRGFPSYSGMERLLCEQSVGKVTDTSPFGRAVSTFLAVAEITGLGASVAGSGFFVTPNNPADQEFAEIAIAAYEKLERGNDWVATGRWLEELIMIYGIHPLVARLKLQGASERSLLRRITEGSTTETGYDRHSLRVLALKGSVPYVKTEHIYRGDFLIPGKSSSSLRIEKVIP